MEKTINIPLTLSTHVLKEKFVSPFKLYIYLSLRYNGSFRYDPQTIINIAKEIGISIKTVNNHLKELFLQHYIGFDNSRQIVYLRSIKQIRTNLRITDKHVINISLRHLPTFKELVIASSIKDLSYRCRMIKKKIRCSVPRGEEPCQAIIIWSVIHYWQIF